jgi:hypothetical protein
MIPVVAFPAVVEQYGPYFEKVFSAEALVEFKRYVSGLLLSENKTVDGINRLLVVESRNQSSLNRLLTESPFSLERLNEARLEVLWRLPATQMKPKGVFSIDDTLLSHYGQEFEQIAKLWDHVSGTYVWAHDLLTLHYSDDETDYSILDLKSHYRGYCYACETIKLLPQKPDANLLARIFEQIARLGAIHTRSLPLPTS